MNYLYRILLVVIVLVVGIGCNEESEPPENFDNFSGLAPAGETTALPATNTQDSTPASIEPSPADTQSPTDTAAPPALEFAAAYAGPIPDGAVTRLGRGEVREVVLSPNAQHLAVSGDLGVFVYRTDTFEQVWHQPMPAGAADVHALTFSPDGSKLAAGYFPIPRTDVWNALTGEPLYFTEGHSDGICAVAFSADGTVMATGSYDDFVMFWNAQTGEPMGSIEGDGAGINGLAYSVDGQQLVVGLDSNSVWSLESGSADWQHSLWAGRQLAYNVAISPDSTHIASGSIDGIILWDATTWEYKLFLDGLAGNAPNLIFSPDSRWVAAGSISNVARIWDVASGDAIKTLGAHTVSFASQGTTFAAGSTDGTIQLWDEPISGQSRTLIGHTGSQMRSAASANGLRAVSLFAEGRVILWDMQSVQPMRDFSIGSRAASAALNTDGSVLAIGTKDGIVQLWDTASGQVIKSIAGHSDEVISLAFSPDSLHLASGSVDETIVVWDTASGTQVMPFIGLVDDSEGLAFSPDGALIAMANGDTIDVHQVQTGEVIRILEGHTNHIHSIAFSPDGRLIASAAHDGTILLWDVTSGTTVAEMSGENQPMGVVFSPDGTRLASGWENGAMLIWDVTTGSMVNMLTGHTKPVSDVMYVGNLIVTGSEDGTMVLWPANP